LQKIPKSQIHQINFSLHNREKLTKYDDVLTTKEQGNEKKLEQKQQ
jgi:hypothetical protein